MLGLKTKSWVEETMLKKVMRVLMSNYVHKGHSLYVDNYYSSVGMAEELLNKNTYLTGTLQFNRKGNPA